jgi:hypothetical protein
VTESVRFWSKAIPVGECLIWMGCTTNNGYGRFGQRLAHRFAYERYVRPIPPGLTIDHLCRNKRCVNVDHMEAVTLAENIRRRPLSGTAAANAAKTRCPMGHPLSGDNLRGGQRINNRSCKACCTQRARERKQARCH